MNYYSDIHARRASAEVAIQADDFRQIREALSYASRILLNSKVPVDVESSSLSIACPGEASGLFDGIESNQGMDLTSQQIVDGDATMSLTVYGRDPHNLRTFRSIPEGSRSTETTTFIELVGPNQDLVNTYAPEHVAVLIDQLLGTHQFYQEARRKADQPFQQFVSGVMKHANRLAKAKRTEQLYQGDLLDLGSEDLREHIDKVAQKRNPDSKPSDFRDHLLHIEATLAIVKPDRQARYVRSTLCAPIKVSQRYPHTIDELSPVEPVTLRETFEVTTPLVNPRHHRALLNPVMPAKLQLENSGAPLARPDDLYMYAKDAAAHAEPVSYVYRSLQILNDHKELGLAPHAIGRIK